MSRKASKIQEFMSNQGVVNCAKWGKSSGQLVALGGEDRKVNVWKLGNPNIVAALHGHTSNVKSVVFDYEENVVVSGSSGGSIKVWDLNTEKAVKSFNCGHKIDVTCLDYHPFGNFFCSGSADTNLKVWDLRKKNFLQTYKGHTEPVNCVKFSPDGRWVVSGGADGVVKLWDLTAGKQMEDFHRHEGPITCIDFHPNEFLLAVGSQDRTITFWDLDKFQPISQAPFDTRPIRCVKFTPDGGALCSATSDLLKVWAWEPVHCHDQVDVRWQNVDDLFVHEKNGELYGVSYIESFVSIWMVKLQKMQPFQSGNYPMSPASDDDGGRTGVTSHILSGTGIAHSHILSSPANNGPPRASMQPQTHDRSSVGPTNTRPTPDRASTHSRVTQEHPTDDKYKPRRQSNTTHQVVVNENASVQHSEQIARDAPAGDRANPSHPTSHASIQQPHHQTHQPPTVTINEQIGASPLQPRDRPTPVHPYGDTRVIPSNHGVPLELDIQQWGKPPQPAGKPDAVLVAEILEDHEAMTKVLQQRLTHVKVLKSLWGQDKKGAIFRVNQLRDNGISVDFLRQVMKSKEKELTLDMCVSLLPIIRETLNSNYETYLSTALDCSLTLWRAFGDLINKTLSQRSHAVDLSLEERKDKCRIARSLFAEVRQTVDLLKDRKDECGNKSRLLYKELPHDRH
eukprot:TRINITY_DN67490_c11_g1_i1.p1 TRINITY_DN67490_c11_g1~~TRINITY_DN67490_c11_g1_i1.p1  ORF type:complete len:701 (-),score=25.99 TRINITY_DN67490_c11_g1_i1:1322-3361(-)